MKRDELLRVLPHDTFYGSLQLRRKLPGFTLAHRIADCPAEEVEIHTHSEAHFVLVTNGFYVSSARGSARSLPLIYNPPGTTHRDHFGQGLGSFFTISVSEDRFGELADVKMLEAASFLTDPVSHGVARALLWECTRTDFSSGLAAESWCLELMADASECPSVSSYARGLRTSRPQWLERAYQLVQDGFARVLTVRELAQAAGVHPVHLARGFRAFFRCSPGELLRMRRLEKAAEQLMLSGLPLAEIALSCGFSDQSHMTTAFRRLYGVSPGRYRTITARHRR